MSFESKMSEIRAYLDIVRQQNSGVNVDATMAFLQEFSGGDLTALRTLKIERLRQASRELSLGLPEGVCSAVVLTHLRTAKSAGAEVPRRRLLRSDFQQMGTRQLVTMHADGPFNTRSFAAIELKQRTKNRPCVVFVGETDSVDIEGTAEIVDARVQDKPVAALFKGQPIFAVGQRPNEMVLIDPLYRQELTLDGKDQTFGLNWGSTSEDMRSFVMYLVQEGHIKTKGFDRTAAALLFTLAKAGDLEAVSTMHGGELVLRDFRVAHAGGLAPRIKVLRSSLRGEGLKKGLEQAVAGK